MFKKLVLAIFFYAFFNTVMKTEGGLITDFRQFHEYTNIRSNYADEKSVLGFRQSENTAEQDDPLQLVKQLKKNHPPRFTGKTLGMTMTTIITTEKSKRSNVYGFEGKRKKTKSLIKVIGHDDRPVEEATVKGPKDINSRAGDTGQPAVIGRSSSTSCGTRRSVATITRVADQTADPNQITTPFVPFTPRTRTQQRLTSTGSKCTTNKWKCDEEIEDEPATDKSNGIETVWQDIMLPTRLPKYQTPIDPVTKLFLKMTSNDRWRRRPDDKCTKPY